MTTNDRLSFPESVTQEQAEVLESIQDRHGPFISVEVNETARVEAVCENGEVWLVDLDGECELDQ